MPKEFNRTRRVSELIQRELAQLIQQEINDPRLGMVTVSAVKVSRELSTAKVYITLLGNTDQRQTTLDVLNHAAGFLRRELGHRLRLRLTPALHFVYDESVSRGVELNELINEAVASDSNKPGD